MQDKSESFAHFSSNLARLLKEKGVRKKDFAKSIHVSPTVISNWLRGEAKGGYHPRRRLLAPIAAYFGISVEELLRAPEAPAAPTQDLAYWRALCQQQQAEIASLKAQLAATADASTPDDKPDKLKEALKLIVDAVADLVEERGCKR